MKIKHPKRSCFLKSFYIETETSAFQYFATIVHCNATLSINLAKLQQEVKRALFHCFLKVLHEVFQCYDTSKFCHYILRFVQIL